MARSLSTQPTSKIPVDDTGLPTSSVTSSQGKYGPEAGQRPFYAVASKRGIKGGPKKISQTQTLRKTAVSKSGSSKSF